MRRHSSRRLGRCRCGARRRQISVPPGGAHIERYQGSAATMRRTSCDLRPSPCLGSEPGALSHVRQPSARSWRPRKVRRCCARCIRIGCVTNCFRIRTLSFGLLQNSRNKFEPTESLLTRIIPSVRGRRRSPLRSSRRSTVTVTWRNQMVEAFFLNFYGAKAAAGL